MPSSQPFFSNQYRNISDIALNFTIWKVVRWYCMKVWMLLLASAPSYGKVYNVIFAVNDITEGKGWSVDI